MRRLAMILATAMLCGILSCANPLGMPPGDMEEVQHAVGR